MSIEVACGVNKITIHAEKSILSGMLHDPQILTQERPIGSLYAMSIVGYRDYYIKTEANDIAVARVFPSRYHDYQEDLTNAAISGASQLSSDGLELYLPVDLFVLAKEAEPPIFSGKMEIYSMSDASAVICSYKLPVNTN